MEGNLNKILIPLAIILAGALIAGNYFYVNKNKAPKENLASAQEAAQKALNYINENLLPKGVTSSLIGDAVEESGLYKFRLKIGEEEYPSYVTKDGKILFPEEGINLEKKIAAEETPTSTQEIQKTDRPDIKLFVMAYCPYGLQMEKAYLPVYNLLKEKADMGIYFVDYLMHGKKEMEENLRQYCIEKEEKEKYLAYLECFIKNGSDDNSEIYKNCLKEAGIDENKLNPCVEETDKEFKISESFTETGYPPFNVHKDLNEKYRVQGSPTLVINDKVIEVSRSPERLKEAICQAFNSPPSECSQTLSDTTFSPGFGLEETSSGSGGQCK